MKLNRLTPELMVKDVNKTVDFYVDVLGFKLVNKVGDEVMIWANVMWDETDVGFMFMKKEDFSEDIEEFKNREVGGSMVLLIEMEGVKELFEKVKNKTEIIKELRETEYGSREFSLKDNNGYILAFVERIEK